MFRYRRASVTQRLVCSGRGRRDAPTMRSAIVKLATIAWMSATLVAAPAAAQSLHETHERVWMPAGKSQIVTWRMKNHTPVATQAFHQAGKHQHLQVRKAPAETARRAQGSGTVGASD